MNTLIPYLFKRGIDDGIGQGNLQILYSSAAIYLSLIFIDYFLRTGQVIMSAIAVNRMVMRLRNALAEHILRLKPSYHDKHLSGALATRTTSDFDNLSDSLNQGVLTAIVDLAVLLGCLIGMFNLNMKLSWVAVVILFIVTWIVNLFSRALRGTMLKARVKVSASNAYTQECMQGSNTLKVLSAQEAAKKRFFFLNEEARKAQMGSVNIDAWMFSVIEGISSITIGIILWSALKWFGFSAEITVGLMVAFVQYIQSLFEPLKSLGSRMAMIQGVFTAIDRIFGVLDVKDFISGDEQPRWHRGQVEFKKVSFSYDQSEKNSAVDNRILKDVSFLLEEGTSTALVGATGGGKSTVVKLLSKLYEGYEGEILVDGQDLTQMEPFAWRRQMAIVPQEITLFKGSLFFNITLGDETISLQDVEEAAEAVGLTSLLEQLPGKWDFQVKEQGENLSHGQRQLLVFARALVKKPRIIILDEATSSVDPASEKIVQEAIEAMMEGRTVIAIAHRLSTIEKCNQILFIRDGEIVERGTHQELLDMDGEYYDMYNRHSL